MKTAKDYITEYVIGEMIESNPEQFAGKTVEGVKEEIEEGEDEDVLHYFNEALGEFRCCGDQSFIKSNKCSRYYDNYEVARILDINGEKIAVGWTYWFGGGKYGEPESVDWLDDAYFCDYTQETRIVDVFTKRV
jgi:hypothetical protein